MSSCSGRLQHRSTIVTGAASGIGREIVHRFASEGAAVVVADVDAESGTAVVEALREAGHTARFVETDVTDPRDVAALAERTIEWRGGIDVLVNNAGGHFGADKLHAQTVEDYERNINVNLKGAFLCARAVLPSMAAADGGAIVHIASVAGVHGTWAPAYSAAKGGIIALSKVIAAQYGVHGIRSNAVCPGVVDTEGKAESMSRRGGDALREEWLSQFPLGRLGRPEDVAAAVAFLASDDAAFVTGTELVVDGGMTSGLDHTLEQMAFDIEEPPRPG